MVNVRFVHGSWRKEDGNRVRIEEAASRWKNVKVTTAPMPEAYGTHHSKMIVLFRHDDLSQIVILTANFIPQDFRMCQAMWRSPRLPLIARQSDAQSPYSRTQIGSGERFERDFMAYLAHYGQSRLGDLVTKLRKVDFSSIRAALICSVPITQSSDGEISDHTLFGWPALRRTLNAAPFVNDSSSNAQIVSQISSVASVGEKWLSQTLFPTLSIGNTKRKPIQHVIFPTADSIRKSTQGYVAGASIHIKTQKPAQKKQLDFLRPMLRHWAADDNDIASVREAGRRRAAPHIKTYIRFRDEAMTSIDWAMLTSANISTQAWGGAENPQTHKVRVCSYEIGVLVWPDLFKEHEDEKAKMVPVFKSDIPVSETLGSVQDGKGQEAVEGKMKTKRVIGWRMPYDLPLVKYELDEMPWSNAVAHGEPDWMGRTWPGYGND